MQATFTIKWYLFGRKAMEFKKLPLLFICVLFVGCNSDDNSGAIIQEEKLSMASFTVIGEDESSVFQFSYDGTTEQGQLQNLTEELGATPNYLTLREVDDLISFYYFSQGAFSLILKDVYTGATASYNDFYANGQGQSVTWGINTVSNVYFGFFGPFGSRNLGIQDVEFRGDLGQDITIDFNIEFVFQPLLFDDKIYFSFKDGQGNYKFTFYNTASKTIGPILNFQDIPISFLIDESGALAIIKNGVAATLEIFDANNLTLVDSQPLNFNTGFSPGPIDGAVLKDNLLYYAFPYVQPAKFSAGPAVFDLTTQENSLVDLFSITAEVEQDLGAAIGITTQIYDASKEVFLIGYGVLGNSTNGGILQISPKGNLIANIPLSFFPSYIVRD